MIILGSDASHQLLLHVSRNGRWWFVNRFVMFPHLGKVFDSGTSASVTDRFPQDLSYRFVHSIDASDLNVFEPLVLRQDTIT